MGECHEGQISLLEGIWASFSEEFRVFSPLKGKGMVILEKRI